MKIPFNRLFLTGKEINYITQAIASSSVSGDGMFDKKVVKLLEQRLCSPKILTTTSGTHSLELAMMLIDIKPGDEVIMPSFTFPSTANAVINRGGIPVFADIGLDNFSMDLTDIQRKITDRTRAIVPVHYGGRGCPMDEIMELATGYGLHVVEDAAQAVGATYKGKALGTWGDMGCFSFHGTKNFVAGEGGAISINIDDPKLIQRAEIIRQKGTNRNQFVRGEVDQYNWVDMGSSFAPSDILMAFLYAQLEDMEMVIDKRKRISDYYSEKLEKYVESGTLVSMTTTPLDMTSNYHNFYILLRNKGERDKVISRMKQKGIQTVIHFVPLHTSPMGKYYGNKPEDLPITKIVGDTLLRLPVYTDMKPEETAYVVDELIKILKELFD
ncbi:MAG: dTDP-4-amino-4,6-dideoxygalactose transaminase [Eubacteriaceae bacterium]|nr:dTDP-4-amino-4,6-dideoxygalactose transaminase [Eubacteriaceae bacterium]